MLVRLVWVGKQFSQCRLVVPDILVFLVGLFSLPRILSQEILARRVCVVIHIILVSLVRRARLVSVVGVGGLLILLNLSKLIRQVRLGSLVNTGSLGILVSLPILVSIGPI